MRRLTLWLCIFAILGLSSFCYAAEKAPAESPIKEPVIYKGNTGPTMIIQMENDTWTGSDRHYTNGAKFSWISRDLNDLKQKDDLPDWIREWIIDYLDEIDIDSDEHLQHNIGLSFGHSIFTPQNTDIQVPDADDRPYAGWLYTSIALHNKSAVMLDTFETTLGIIGPSARGREVQNGFHELIDVPKAEGWESQLHDELGLMLSWQRSNRIWQHSQEDNLKGWGTDLITHFGATVGNVQTYANVGGEFRFGYDLPMDFGTSVIRPGTGVQAPVEQNRSTKNRGFGWHIFTGVDARAVARDIFLDGNTFESSPHVTKENFVADITNGIAFIWNNTKLTYTTVLRSKEFKEQEEFPHFFGSITISHTF
ncbi:MAG: lipid A deacylase LpxR family protein [Desulfovibrio sp.]